MTGSPQTVVAEVLQLFAERGESAYGGEVVTQREHAIQAAYFARQAGASDSVVVAALLHDVGHLLHDLPDDAPEQGVDDLHEELAAKWLAERFGPDVVEPVRLHVQAKRYLCATVPGYYDALSEPSKISLRLQGGPMGPEETEAFRTLPYGEDAATLRRADDSAKIEDFPVPDVEDYIPSIEKVLAKS